MDITTSVVLNTLDDNERFWPLESNMQALGHFEHHALVTYFDCCRERKKIMTKGEGSDEETLAQNSIIHVFGTKPGSVVSAKSTFSKNIVRTLNEQLEKTGCLIFPRCITEKLAKYEKGAEFRVSCQ